MQKCFVALSVGLLLSVFPTNHAAAWEAAPVLKSLPSDPTINFVVEQVRAPRYAKYTTSGQVVVPNRFIDVENHRLSLVLSRCVIVSENEFCDTVASSPSFSTFSGEENNYGPQSAFKISIGALALQSFRTRNNIPDVTDEYLKLSLCGGRFIKTCFQYTKLPLPIDTNLMEGDEIRVQSPKKHLPRGVYNSQRDVVVQSPPDVDAVIRFHYGDLPAPTAVKKISDRIFNVSESGVLLLKDDPLIALLRPNFGIEDLNITQDEFLVFKEIFDEAKKTPVRKDELSILIALEISFQQKLLPRQRLLREKYLNAAISPLDQLAQYYIRLGVRGFSIIEDACRKHKQKAALVANEPVELALNLIEYRQFNIRKTVDVPIKSYDIGPLPMPHEWATFIVADLIKSKL